MSLAVIRGVSQNLPKASITFDRFHVTRVLADAVDKIRREEWRTDKVIKGIRYLVLKNPENLTEKQEADLPLVIARNARLAEAYRLKEASSAISMLRRTGATVAASSMPGRLPPITRRSNQ